MLSFNLLTEKGFGFEAKQIALIDLLMFPQQSAKVSQANLIGS